jgi:filamentous hemagglutinin family protein
MRLGILLSLVAIPLGLAHATGGIATDGSVGGPDALGRPQTLRGAQLVIPENLGSRTDANLFHSFKEFNIQTGQTVTFTEKTPNSLDRVITRVTGPAGSDLEGTLRSTPGGHADFYLINPQGVTFGPKSRVDVPAAFHVSTADQVKFKDGGTFSAVDPNASTLSSAAPVAFGFLGTSQANNGLLKMNGAGWAAKAGQTIDLVGGGIQIENTAQVKAPAGEIRLVARRGEGEVGLEKTAAGNLPLPVETPSEKNSGALQVRDSELLSSGRGGGRIGIWGGKTEIVGQQTPSHVWADNEGNRDAGESHGVEIRAHSVRVDNSSITSDALGRGKAGHVVVTSHGELAMLNGGGLAAARLPKVRLEAWWSRRTGA